MAQNGASFVVVLFLFLARFAVLVTAIPAQYNAARESYIQQESKRRLGGSGNDLSPKEQQVNDILLKEKRRIIKAARTQGGAFPTSKNFLVTRAAIEQTEAFKIIKKMPKGGALHLHDEAITSIDWLIKNATYRPNCYACVKKDQSVVAFKFFTTAPRRPDCSWRTLADLRRVSGDSNAFDKRMVSQHTGKPLALHHITRALHRRVIPDRCLKAHAQSICAGEVLKLVNSMSMVVSDPHTAYPDIDAVWRKFMNYFNLMEGLFLYAPVFKDYLYEGLLQFRKDNVQYLEIRALLPKVYELDGTTHDKQWVLNAYKNISDQFVRDYPDFTGIRIIKTAIKFETKAAILKDIKEATRLHQLHPEFMVGYDLVGQEDTLGSLLHYQDELLQPSSQRPVKLPYFLHAGETNWQDTESDYNLLDALLLNTTRIGHGYALVKHPVLLEEVKRRDIAIEINPISNQVLKLVGDLRNHPATFLLANNYPVVISSDDPSAWQARPLSHDFYVTFMALTGENTGLATLKQLAHNSLRYSALTPKAKLTAIKEWRRKWDQFINDMTDLGHPIN